VGGGGGRGAVFFFGWRMVDWDRVRICFLSFGLLWFKFVLVFWSFFEVVGALFFVFCIWGGLVGWGLSLFLVVWYGCFRGCVFLWRWGVCGLLFCFLFSVIGVGCLIGDLLILVVFVFFGWWEGVFCLVIWVDGGGFGVSLEWGCYFVVYILWDFLWRRFLYDN